MTTSTAVKMMKKKMMMMFMVGGICGAKPPWRVHAVKRLREPAASQSSPHAVSSERRAQRRIHTTTAVSLWVSRLPCREDRSSQWVAASLARREECSSKSAVCH
jgi:hypothetical protein